ncbi:MAG: ferrochelatase [Proteobacteria bacterium]|nr:ferrochelatase [Pseudomonadota bacterium]
MKAVLIVSFGGPEGPDQVLPFLRSVTQGRNIPDARLAAVGKHYDHFGGVSPLPRACRELAGELDERTYLGNLYSAPRISEAFDSMAADGITSADVIVLSSFGSDASCRRYAKAVRKAEIPTRRLPLIGAWPGFVEVWRAVLPKDDRRVVFTAHSLPASMADCSPYEARIRAACAQVGAERTWTLAWQSRSGNPRQPWLGPDVNEVIEDGDVVVPLGFPTNNLEIEWDLGVEAATIADIEVVRPPPLGELARAALASDVRLPEVCGPACCER